MDRSKLSERDVKNLLLARKKADELVAMQYGLRISQVTGRDLTPPLKDPQMDMVIDFVYGVLAKKLKGERCEGLLVSIEDFKEFLSAMANLLIPKTDSFEEFAIYSEYVEKTVDIALNQIIKIVNRIEGKNQYDAYWLWIETAISLSESHNMDTESFVMLDYAGDRKITKNVFSKEEFIANITGSIDTLFDTKYMVIAIIQPMLEMLCDGDKELEEELRQVLEAELEPQLSEFFEIAKVVIREKALEDAQKIYG